MDPLDPRVALLVVMCVGSTSLGLAPERGFGGASEWINGSRRFGGCRNATKNVSDFPSL